jgi:amino acid transporter
MGAIDSGSAGAAASPWVLGLLEVGIGGFLPHLINALILMSGLSCGNAFLYASSRTLYSLAQDGMAPKQLLKCTKAGVPWVAVNVVTVISLLTFMTASNQASDVFQWFLELTTVALVVNFTAMSVVFIGWCRALKAQGVPRIGRNTLQTSRRCGIFPRKSVEVPDETSGGIIFPYAAPGGSWTPYTCLALGSTITIFIGFDIFQPFLLRGFITSYFGLAWFVFMFVFWKIFKKTKLVKPAEVDIFAGGLKRQIDDDCRVWEEGFADESEQEKLKEMNFLKRAWYKMWN